MLNVILQEVLNIYNEAYSLLLEILLDQHLQDFVLENTGKHLAIINSDIQVSAPAAKINFNGGNISLAENSIQQVNYNVAFYLPLSGDNAFAVCHDFIDHAVLTFINHENKTMGKRNYVTGINPSIIEPKDASEDWIVAFDVAISIFL